MTMTSALLNPDSPPSAAADDAAFPAGLSVEALYALHGQRIFRFLLASSRDRDLAETLTQETFLKAWSARHQFRGQSSAVTWLTRIALNLLRDHTRTERFRFWKRAAPATVDAAELALHLPDHQSSAEARLIARQQVEILATTVAALSERQRTVFLLRFIEQLELPEIALVTGLPLPTVKTHLYRSLAAVRSRQPQALSAERKAPR